MTDKNELDIIENSPLEINGVSLSDLPPKKQRFFHLYVTGKYSNIDIADLIGVHVNTVSNWLRDEEFSSFLKHYQEEEHKANITRLSALTNKAIDTMSDLLDSPIDGVRYQSAKDILDRTNFKPSQNINVKKEVYSYEEKIERLAEITINDNDVIDLVEGDGYEVIDDG